MPTKSKKNPAAVTLGRKGGLQTAKRSKKARSQAARHAVAARWEKWRAERAKAGSKTED